MNRRDFIKTLGIAGGTVSDSCFSHPLVECNPTTGKRSWFEPVSDADYQVATGEK